MLDWSNIRTVLPDMDGTLLDLYYDNHFWREHVPMRFAEKQKITLDQAKQELSSRYHHRAGTLEWYCVGFWSANWALGGQATNHAPRFAGGRVRGTFPGLGQNYSVSLWFRNEIANHVRPVTGYVFSRGAEGASGAPGDHLGLSGTHLKQEGRIFVFNGNSLDQVLLGKTVIPPRTWNHVLLVREGRKVSVYLNGQLAWHDGEWLEVRIAL